jgi:hypothetical protein
MRSEIESYLPPTKAWKSQIFLQYRPGAMRDGVLGVPVTGDNLEVDVAAPASSILSSMDSGQQCRFADASGEVSQRRTSSNPLLDC